MKCWNCGHRMELVNDGKWAGHHKCPSCGRVVPKKRPESPYLDSDNGYGHLIGGEGAVVSGAFGTGYRTSVSGAVRVRAYKPATTESGAGAVRPRVLCTTLYEGCSVGEKTRAITLDTGDSITLRSCPFGSTSQPSDQPSSQPRSQGGAP